MATQHPLSISLVITYITTFVFIGAGGVLLGLAAFESVIAAVPPLDTLYATLVAIILLLLGTNCLLVAMVLHRDQRPQYQTAGRRAAPSTRSDESHAPFKPDPDPDRGSTEDTELGTAIRPDANTRTTGATDSPDDADDDETTDPDHDPHAPFKPDS